MDPHLILQNTELCIAHKQQGGGIAEGVKFLPDYLIKD